MKKSIVVTVLLLVGISALRAQQEVAPSPEIASKFAEQFTEATNVKWSKVGTVLVARFNNQKSFRIAYYDQAGDLIAKGRKISEAQLPMNVYEDLQSIKNDWKSKSGKLAMGSIYEFLRQSGETEYVTTLENDQHTMTLSTAGGKLGIRKKVKKNIMEQPQDLIAKAPNE